MNIEDIENKILNLQLRGIKYVIGDEFHLRDDSIFKSVFTCTIKNGGAYCVFNLSSILDELIKVIECAKILPSIKLFDLKIDEDCINFASAFKHYSFKFITDRVLQDINDTISKHDNDNNILKELKNSHYSQN